MSPRDPDRQDDHHADHRDEHRVDHHTHHHVDHHVDHHAHHRDEHPRDHDHPHAHEQDALVVEDDAGNLLGQQMVLALQAILERKGVLSPGEVTMEIQKLEAPGTHLGARIVARAWVDADYKARLLHDGKAAAAELDIKVGEAQLVVVENSPREHNVVVCTLCSCYPRSILGQPPSWYISKAYRARTVREPAKVLAEFGLRLPAGTAICVHDSTADMRFLVLPMRPEHTAGWTEEQLARLVTRDSMIGVAAALAVDRRAGRRRGGGRMKRRHRQRTAAMKGAAGMKGTAKGVAAALLLAASAAALAQPMPVLRTTHTYATAPAGAALKADLYDPQASPFGASRPVVVFIHGGGWTCGNREAFGDIPRRLAEAYGVVAVSASYRLAPVTDAVIENGRIVAPGTNDGCPADSAPDEDLGLPQQRAPFPAALSDLRELMRQLRRNAVALRIDPQRIALLGASAGAHLAGLLGGEADETRPNAIITVSGPWDLSNPGLLPDPSVPGILRNLFGADPTPQQLQAASPIRYAAPPARFPPTLLIHGEKDTLVPASQSVAACAALPVCAYGQALLVQTPARVDPHDGLYLLLASQDAVLNFLASVFGLPPGRAQVAGGAG